MFSSFDTLENISTLFLPFTLPFTFIFIRRNILLKYMFYFMKILKNTRNLVEIEAQ